MTPDRMDSSTLSSNVMHFARLLRRAGLPVGPAETIAAQNALTQIDLGSKTETRTALRAVMTHRHEHQDVFDQAFALFWRDPSAAEQAAAMALLDAQKQKPERPPPAARRVAEAFRNPNQPKPKVNDEPPVQDAVLTVSDQERLQTMDFDAMSAGVGKQYSESVGEKEMRVSGHTDSVVAEAVEEENGVAVRVVGADDPRKQD